MRFILHYRGSPLQECATLVEAYLVMRDEFKKRWPRAIYGTQEAAAHGYTVVGKPELTPHEAREMREGRVQIDDRYELSIANAYRKGVQ
jgi:hypothetical protein